MPCSCARCTIIAWRRRAGARTSCPLMLLRRLRAGVSRSASVCSQHGGAVFADQGTGRRSTLLRKGDSVRRPAKGGAQVEPPRLGLFGGVQARSWGRRRKRQLCVVGHLWHRDHVRLGAVSLVTLAGRQVRSGAAVAASLLLPSTSLTLVSSPQRWLEEFSCCRLACSHTRQAVGVQHAAQVHQQAMRKRRPARSESHQSTQPLTYRAETDRSRSLCSVSPCHLLLSEAAVALCSSALTCRQWHQSMHAKFGQTGARGRRKCARAQCRVVHDRRTHAGKPTPRD